MKKAAPKTRPSTAPAAASRPTKRRIKVCVRKRPLPPGGGEDVVSCEPKVISIRDVQKRLDLSEFTRIHDFHFDQVFADADTTATVYRHTAKPLLDVFLGGGKASCFAYGQTGSGKTHTMLGDPASGQDGLFLMAAKEIFAHLKPTQQLAASMYEIYCQKVFDLLVPSKSEVFVREDGEKRVNICGLTEHPVSSPQALLKFLEVGAKHRANGTTAANSRSSRSHAILQLVIQEKDGKGKSSLDQPRLVFVDLAGSERGADTADRDKKTQREGAEINKSLLALKECIRGLDMGHKHIKFRGSKLTEVLRESFVGNCSTCMIATVTPTRKDIVHTLNTLRYAHRVKSLPPVSVKAEATPTPAKSQRRRRSIKLPRWSGGSKTRLFKKKRRSFTVVARYPPGHCQACGSKNHHTLLCRKGASELKRRRPSTQGSAQGSLRRGGSKKKIQKIPLMMGMGH
eukprot:Sspe_Gene.65886::Locus_38957_Transcript_1_1_Confidence_1.000_Length_1586::g.65886::m.65886/K10393/KIF2_24, MCAK; kinesin family member 2/24